MFSEMCVIQVPSISVRCTQRDLLLALTASFIQTLWNAAMADRHICINSIPNEVCLRFSARISFISRLFNFIQWHLFATLDIIILCKLGR